MANRGVDITFKVEGLPQLSKNVDLLKAYFETYILPYKQAATVVTGSVMKNFREGGRPEAWKPLSPLTYFIRSHRSGKKNTQAKTLVDTARTMNSIVPHFSLDAKGGQFGAKTNVKHARRLHFGGLSDASSVVIGAFKRNTPSGGTARVRSYVMNIKSGHQIPARPFMMVQEEDKPVIRQVFIDWAKGASNGEYR
jgi:phage gpG-like protein